MRTPPDPVVWKGIRTTKCWAIIKPDGNVVADSTFDSEHAAWFVVLGWPSDDEIEDAKRRGFRAARVTVMAIEE